MAAGLSDATGFLALLGSPSDELLDYSEEGVELLMGSGFGGDGSLAQIFV